MVAILQILEVNVNDQILIHHGVKGMKWGVRRYQNPDGSLTDAGKKRYRINADGSIEKLSRAERKAVRQEQAAQARKRSLDDYISGRDQKFLARTSARQQIDETRSKANREFRKSKQGKDLYDEWDARYDTVDSLTKLRRQLEGSDPNSTVAKVYLDSRLAEEKRALDTAARRVAEAEGRNACSRLIREYGEVGFERFMNDSLFVSARKDGESYVDWYVRVQYDSYKWDED